jgi:hydroxymethylbilane synthase
VRAGEFDALILAAAGVTRLKLLDAVTEHLPRSLMLPAVGQGALGIEGRDQDDRVRTAVATLDHAATHAAVRAERALLAALSGGCLAPVGAWGRVDGELLYLDAVVLSGDGRTRLAVNVSGSVTVPEQLGQRAAGDLLGQGAGALIDACRQAEAAQKPSQA